ncbi:unnamed protein product [Musa acuminata subsp. burmannicoides]
MQNKEIGTNEAQQTTARYKGVRLRKWGKWVAEVRFPNSRQRLWLGSYPTPEMAARAYDAAVYCLRGPGAAFNFPSHPPSIPSADKLSRYEIREAAERHAREGPQQEEAEEAGEQVVDPGAGSSGLGVPSGQPAEPSSSVPVFDDATVSGGEWFDGFWYDAGGGNDDDDIYRSSPLWNFHQ